MTPDEIIDQIVFSYGQLAGKRDDILDWLQEVVREVEYKTLPEYMYSETTVSLSGATSHMLTGVAAVESVAHNNGDTVLFRVTQEGMDKVWSGVSDCLFYHLKEQPTGIMVYFNAAPTDDVVFRVREYTTITASDTNYDELDYIYPTVLQGLHVKSCMILKDMERMKAYEARYMGALGELPKGGQ